jgi:hypothetical protein
MTASNGMRSARMPSAWAIADDHAVVADGRKCHEVHAVRESSDVSAATWS